MCIDMKTPIQELLLKFPRVAKEVDRCVALAECTNHPNPSAETVVNGIKKMLVTLGDVKFMEIWGHDREFLTDFMMFVIELNIKCEGAVK